MMIAGVSYVMAAVIARADARQLIQVIEPHAACALAQGWRQHVDQSLALVGQTVTVKGAYQTDGERSVFWPDGCEAGFAAAVGPDVMVAISQAREGWLKQCHTYLLGIRYEGSFTGTFTKGPANNFEHFRDDGIRFRLVSVEDGHIAGQPPDAPAFVCPRLPASKPGG
jgi:hypothetical protein